MSSAQAMTALTISGSVAFGMVLALLGHLKLALARRPEHVTGKVDLLLFLLNFALIPMMLAAGLLVDFWGVGRTLLTGSILLTLGFLALSGGPAYTRCLIAVTAAAFGASAVGVGSLALMPAGLFGVSESTASLQFGLVLVSLGALLTPPLIDVLLRGLGFGRTMAVVALLMLAPAFLVWLSVGALPPVQTDASALGTLLRYQGVWVAGLVFFFYAPLEAFVSVWTTTLLASIDKPQWQGRWLAGFWSAFLLSRLAVAFLLSRLAVAFIEQGWALRGDILPRWALAVCAILAAVVIGNLSGAIRPEHAGKSLVVLGCFMGPLFPLLVGLLYGMLTPPGPSSSGTFPAFPGTAFGLIFACGSVGSLALAPLVGFSARARHVHVALRIPLFIALLLAGATIIFVLLAKRMGE